MSLDPSIFYSQSGKQNTCKWLSISLWVSEGSVQRKGLAHSRCLKKANSLFPAAHITLNLTSIINPFSGVFSAECLSENILGWEGSSKNSSLIKETMRRPSLENLHAPRIDCHFPLKITWLVQVVGVPEKDSDCQWQLTACLCLFHILMKFSESHCLGIKILAPVCVEVWTETELPPSLTAVLVYRDYFCFPKYLSRHCTQYKWPDSHSEAKQKAPSFSDPGQRRTRAPPWVSQQQAGLLLKFIHNQNKLNIHPDFHREQRSND